MNGGAFASGARTSGGAFVLGVIVVILGEMTSAHEMGIRDDFPWPVTLQHIDASCLRMWPHQIQKPVVP